jgi:hypothetical protein
MRGPSLKVWLVLMFCFASTGVRYAVNGNEASL